MIIETPHNYLEYGVAAALGVLAYLFWKEKGDDLNKSQHGHLHIESIDYLEHQHPHWHNIAGTHIHSHVHELYLR
jgi:hypothetical protein